MDSDDADVDAHFAFSSQQACIEHAFATSIKEPASYRDAMSRPDSVQWEEACGKEIGSIMANNTWDVVHLPTGRKPIACKWVFRIKYRPHGSIDQYKARLVAKGFTQQYGLDYTPLPRS